MGLCQHCKRPLRAIGNNRKNGASHKQPRRHRFHKKCYRLGAYLETQRAESGAPEAKAEQQRLQAVMNDIVERLDITTIFPSSRPDFYNDNQNKFRNLSH